MKIKLICCSLFLIYVHHAFSQSTNKYLSAKDADPKAKAILKQVKAQFPIDKGVELNFNLKIAQAESAAANQKGIVQITGKKFRIDLADQVLVSDGNTLWTYLKKRNEIQIQDANLLQDDVLSPFQLLNIHESTDYTYIWAGEIKKGNLIMDIIDFKPLDSKADFFKIEAKIDRIKKHYKEIHVYLKNGDHYILELSNQVKKIMPPTVFILDPKNYPGAHTEDLR